MLASLFVCFGGFFLLLLFVCLCFVLFSPLIVDGKEDGQVLVIRVCFIHRILVCTSSVGDFLVRTTETGPEKLGMRLW